MKESLKNGLLKRRQLAGLQDFQSLMIGSSFRAKVLKEGGLVKEGKAKVEDRVVSIFNEDL